MSDLDAALRPLDRPLLREQIISRLMEALASGALRPGDRLVESELAERLGTSRIPIREALVQLQEDRLVDLRPARGAVVHVATANEVNCVFQVRRALEGEAVALAVGTTGPSEYRELHRIIDQGLGHSKAQRHVESAELNRQFHRYIAELTGNTLLIRLLVSIERRVQLFFSQVAPIRGHHSWLEHLEIVRVMEANDTDRAVQLMRRHIEATHSQSMANIASPSQAKGDSSR